MLQVWKADAAGKWSALHADAPLSNFNEFCLYSGMGEGPWPVAIAGKLHMVRRQEGKAGWKPVGTVTTRRR